MDLAKTQLLLVRLYTDAALRNRFFSDPEGIGPELGLNRQDAREFSNLSARQVNFFAASLIGKRLSEVSKLMPLTRRALGTRFDTFFCRYADSHRLETSQPHQNDAVSFSAFLKYSALTEFSATPWILDLARYEAACLEAIASRRRRLMVRLFRYNIREILRRVVEEDPGPVPKRRPTLAIWLRFSSQARPRFVAFLLATNKPMRERSLFQRSSDNGQKAVSKH